MKSNGITPYNISPTKKMSSSRKYIIYIYSGIVKQQHDEFVYLQTGGTPNFCLFQPGKKDA